MEIITRDFGPVTVEDNSVYTFPNGIFGFEETTEFALFVKVLAERPFLYLHATQDVTPFFLVFDPEEFVEQYHPTLSPEDLATLGAEKEDELVFLVIATLPESVTDLSVNLKSPIVLCPATKKAAQCILQNSEYPIKYFPFKQGAQSAAASVSAHKGSGKDGA